MFTPRSSFVCCDGCILNLSASGVKAVRRSDQRSIAARQPIQDTWCTLLPHRGMQIPTGAARALDVVHQLGAKATDHQLHPRPPLTTAKTFRPHALPKNSSMMRLPSSDSLSATIPIGASKYTPFRTRSSSARTCGRTSVARGFNGNNHTKICFFHSRILSVVEFCRKRICAVQKVFF